VDGQAQLMSMKNPQALMKMSALFVRKSSSAPSAEWSSTMSEEVPDIPQAARDALEAAIQAIVDIEHPGFFLTGFVLQLKAQDLEDEKRLTWYRQITPEHQSYDITLGLYGVGAKNMQDIWDD